MATLARFTIAIILALLSSSCIMDVGFGSGVKGNGEVVQESRDITEDFTAVTASEGLNVYVTQGSDFKIRVEADENVIDLIGTDIRDGKLKVHAIENIGRATKKIYVTMPEVTSLAANSGADLIGDGLIEADKINLDSSSGAGLKVEIVADQIEANSSSGADIRLGGRANLLYADASSGSDIKAVELESKICRANASSGADIRVNVTEELTAHASSGADIGYSGEPKVETRKSASGSVYKN
ncbi:head GIN domain-containing protein [Robiginitalea aurantiaca]|uniref:Head GIN domain-containing protein n=1 Tax=Robiginitalea aurantiaca TaxID=3056915 RepID=A0ABT7WCK7_9FLAO|nr:head GIN domain-containing protein [Robiginitalea aurantiaca]MDM9630650.1 head GIN domain-containing protein [Robiginitalea aurantiaca]